MIGAGVSGASSRKIRSTGWSSIASNGIGRSSRAKMPHSLLSAGKLAVRDRDPRADPGAAEPLPFDQHIVDRRAPGCRSLRRRGWQAPEAPAFVGARNWATTLRGVIRSAISISPDSARCRRALSCSGAISRTCVFAEPSSAHDRCDCRQIRRQHWLDGRSARRIQLGVDPPDIAVGRR